jgi:predicted O-linked N-acetylglucosamine transferase (SPINDLY family)
MGAVSQTEPDRQEIDILLSHYNHGRFVEAENLARLMTERFPLYGFGWKVLSVVFKQTGRNSDAVMSMQRAVDLLPGEAEAHNNLGAFLKDMGRLAEAETSLRRALQIDPDFAEVYNNLGAVLKDMGRLAEAETSLRRALQIRPDYVAAHNNLGTTLSDQGRYAEAETSLRQALQIQPDFADGHLLLGSVLQHLARHNEAEASFQQALALRPDFVEAHLKLGNTLLQLGRKEEALEKYRRVIQINPLYIEAHNNLGATLMDLGRFVESECALRRALDIKPDYAEAHSNLGILLMDMGRIFEAQTCFRLAIQIKPDYVEAHSNLLFLLSHSEGVMPDTVFAEHLRFGEQFEEPLKPYWPSHSNLRQPDKRLRVGIVSGDLRNHVVSSFIMPVLKFLNRQQIELLAYSNNMIEDAVTIQIQGMCDGWNRVAGLSDVELTDMIVRDRVDILLDLSGHTAANRLMTFARKPAPIQISWIGYPNTSGLKAMDYSLKDRFSAPYGAYERYYVEKLIRLPGAATFLQLQDAPAVSDLPALSTGHVTFGSFNRPGKLGDSVIALWSKVLQAVPGSRLLLGSVSGDSTRQMLLERFLHNGVAADRLIFKPKVEMMAYLALHHQVDIILDTFPFTGGTTTNFALWMGVPVLTMTGPSSMHCISAGILGRAGLTDWVASDQADFVRLASNWAGRLEELANLRMSMRDRLLSSPLRQPETVARGLEFALRTAWRHWCNNGEAPESFEVTLRDIGMDSPMDNHVLR